MHHPVLGGLPVGLALGEAGGQVEVAGLAREAVGLLHPADVLERVGDQPGLLAQLGRREGERVAAVTAGHEPCGNSHTRRPIV